MKLIFIKNTQIPVDQDERCSDVVEEVMKSAGLWDDNYLPIGDHEEYITLFTKDEVIAAFESTKKNNPETYEAILSELEAGILFNSSMSENIEDFAQNMAKELDKNYDTWYMHAAWFCEKYISNKEGV